MSERPGFMLYFDMTPALSGLDDGEAGRLFKALMAYARYGEVQELTGLAEFAFQVMRPRIDRDEQVYREKCRKNAYNAYVRLSRQRGENPVDYENWDGRPVDERSAASTIVDDRQPTTTATATPTTKTISKTISKTNQRSGSSSAAAADSDTAWVLPFLEERKMAGRR